MTSQLVGADFTGGALLPNYVNGRLLVAEDLATGQASLTQRDTAVGEAAGSGVVRGLWVTGTATQLTVAPGLALSRSGEPVVVRKNITLPIAITTAALTADASRFTCCATGSPTTTGGAIAAGAYLLTARPAAQLQGRAPLASAPGSSAAPGCTAQWRVEGVEFRAVALPLDGTVAGVPISVNNRRNLTAHWCLGTERLADLGADPFAFPPAYSGFDQLDPADLAGSDVPLAVFHWSGKTVEDLDNWSARQRVTAPDPVTASWSALVGDRREAGGEARFLQFQDQAAAYVDAGTASIIDATDVFPVLPPVGFLPIGGPQNAVNRLLGTFEPNELPDERPPRRTMARAAARSGFDVRTFFSSHARYGGVVSWDLADLALRQSWRMAAVRLPAESASDSPPFTFYLVAENVRTGGKLGYYVVFVANVAWFSGTKPPIVPGQLFVRE